MGDALLQIQDLRTTFYTRDGLVRAVDGVSIEIEAGESVGIVGESGCGKSMTAMSLMGLLKKPGKVDGGSIVFDGQELLAMTAKDRRKLMGNRISMIFQEPMTSLNPVITVGRQVREALLLHNKGMSRSQAKERVIQMFQLVGDSGRAKAVWGVSPSVVRRPAPEGDDRHGYGVRPWPFDRG